MNIGLKISKIHWTTLNEINWTQLRSLSKSCKKSLWYFFPKVVKLISHWTRIIIQMRKKNITICVKWVHHHSFHSLHLYAVNMIRLKCIQRYLYSAVNRENKKYNYQTQSTSKKKIEKEIKQFAINIIAYVCICLRYKKIHKKVNYYDNISHFSRNTLLIFIIIITIFLCVHKKEIGRAIGVSVRALHARSFANCKRSNTQSRTYKT